MRLLGLRTTKHLHFTIIHSLAVCKSAPHPTLGSKLKQSTVGGEKTKPPLLWGIGFFFGGAVVELSKKSAVKTTKTLQKVQ